MPGDLERFIALVLRTGVQTGTQSPTSPATAKVAANNYDLMSPVITEAKIAQDATALVWDVGNWDEHVWG